MFNRYVFNDQKAISKVQCFYVSDIPQRNSYHKHTIIQVRAWDTIHSQRHSTMALGLGRISMLVEDIPSHGLHESSIYKLGFRWPTTDRAPRMVLQRECVLWQYGKGQIRRTERLGYAILFGYDDRGELNPSTKGKRHEERLTASWKSMRCRWDIF